MAEDTPENARENARAARTRRRFARRQWARRWGAWRWVLVGVLVSGGLVGGVWLLYFSETLSVQGTTVSGTGYLDSEAVAEAAAAPTGEPLVSVDLDAIAARVEALGPVRSVEVTRSWPDHVRIVIVERTAVAVVEVGSTLHGMDKDGVLFREYPRVPRGLPVVRALGGASLDARREAATVVSAMPSGLSKRVDHLEVESVDQITLVLRNGRTVTWGSAEESATKARVLEALLAEHQADHYDVSVPGQPTTRG